MLDAARIVVEHAAFIWRVLTHLGVPQGRLHDASQEVCVAVLRSGAAFEERSSLQTWLYGVCRNVALTERRRWRARTEVPTEELPETIVQAAQEGELWIKQAHQSLIAALHSLSEEQREVFVLFEIEELTMEQIANALQAPLSTCYSRLYAAREKVHSALRRRALTPLEIAR
jgi:RNA polymerase sigma-70 factor, ECF subfamily